MSARIKIETKGRQYLGYHVVEPRWTQLSHHRLREGVVRCLEQTEHDIVGPAFDQQKRLKLL